MKNFFKRFALWLLQGIIGAVVVLFFAFMMAEWFAGCGETYTDSKGRVHINECLLTKHHKTTPNT